MCPETTPEESNDRFSGVAHPREMEITTHSQMMSTNVQQLTFENDSREHNSILDEDQTVPNPLVGCAPSEIDLDGDGVTAD